MSKYNIYSAQTIRKDSANISHMFQGVLKGIFHAERGDMELNLTLYANQRYAKYKVTVSFIN